MYLVTRYSLATLSADRLKKKNVSSSLVIIVSAQVLGLWTLDLGLTIEETYPTLKDSLRQESAFEPQPSINPIILENLSAHQIENFLNFSKLTQF